MAALRTRSTTCHYDLTEFNLPDGDAEFDDNDGLDRTNCSEDDLEDKENFLARDEGLIHGRKNQRMITYNDDVDDQLGAGLDCDDGAIESQEGVDIKVQGNECLDGDDGRLYDSGDPGDQRGNDRNSDIDFSINGNIWH